jgi:hypothetical protein
MNPRPGNDDESKMRGHLGTELGNKITDTLVSIKKKDSSGVTFTVKQLDARNKDMDDWKFEVTDASGALGIPRITTTVSESKQPEHDDVADIKAWIKKAEDKLTWPMTRNDVKQKIFGEIGGQKNNDKRQADLNIALNLKYLVESSIKKKGFYLLEIGDDMPF